MATKKQKREAALAKREQFMAEEKARGLAAQGQSRVSEVQERKRLSEVAQRVNIHDVELLKGRSRTTPVGPVEHAWKGHKRRQGNNQ